MPGSIDLNVEAQRKTVISSQEGRTMKTQGMQGQVVITIDVETGNLVSVTDETGNHFEQFTPTQEDPLIFREVYSGVNLGTIFYARTNPCYKWYYRDGVGWYRRQVACP